MNMKEFLTKLAADRDLAEKMSKATDPDNAYTIAKAAGLTETFEAFTAAMKKLNESCGEINAAEADKIAGGTDATIIITDDGPLIPPIASASI